MSKKNGKHHAGENDKTCLCERHFPSAIPKGEGKKRERPSKCCFVCSYIPGHFSNRKEHLIGVKNVENCYVVVPCFKIYHTERDFKKHGQLLREGVMAMEGVDNGD